MRVGAVLILAISLVLLAPHAQAQIPRTLSYQGVLADSTGVPKPNGAYSITFRLYDLSGGGSPISSETKLVNVQRGLFSTILGDVVPFADSVRFDRPYWLGIQVGGEPELAPRIPLTSVGYSISSIRSDTAVFAMNAPLAGAVDSARVAGTVPNASITSVKIAAGQVVKSLNGMRDGITLQAQGGATLTSSGDTITINSGAGGGGTGIQGVQNTNSTLDIQNPNGPTATVNVKVPLTLSGNVASTPTLTATNSGSGGVGIYAVSDSTHGTYSATNSTAFGASGVLGVANASNGFVVGTYGLALNSPLGTGVTGWGTLQGVYGTSAASNGVVGQSTSSNGVYGLSATGVGVRGEATQLGPGAYGVYGRSPGLIGVFGENTGTGSGGSGVYGKTSAITGAAVTGMSSNTEGVNYGVVGYTNSPQFAAAGVRGEALATSGQTIGVEGISTASSTGTGVVGRGSATGGYFEAFNADGYAGFFNGRVSVSVLEISGGGDLAEPFESEEESALEPGSLVSIDPIHPGKLGLSREEYDGKVAGVVSGANGINPGITLTQKNSLEGQNLVAIAGRVYCWAEASSVPIEPGDLLTSSSFPGHVMKARDRNRSHGTVIGKAMTGLKEGRGLVLVLVNLQ